MVEIDEKSSVNAGNGSNNSSEDASIEKNGSKKQLTHPPLLLASYALPITTFSSYMYSLARIGIFGFQPGVRLSPWALAATFGVPSALSAVWRLCSFFASDFVHIRDSFLRWDYAAGLRLLGPSNVAGCFVFAKRLVAELLTNLCLPNKTLRPGFGIAIPRNALVASYVSEFLLPMMYSKRTGNFANIITRPLQVLNVWLTDIALTTAFIHLPVACYIVPSISLIFSYIGTYYVIDRESMAFSDPIYDRWASDSRFFTWSQFWEMCLWAIDVDLSN